MASSTEQQLTNVKIHKIPDIETWKSLYGTPGGIGDGDVVVFDPDVITERPLNVTFGTKTTLVDTTTLAFAKNTDDKYCTIENPISGFTKNQFQQNKLYIVTWDGVEYQTLVRIAENKKPNTDYYEWSYFGNANILDWANASSLDNSLPFCIEYDFYRNSGEVQFFANNNAANHTVKIETIPFTVNKIDPAYYADTINQVPLIRKGTGIDSIIIGTGPRTASGTLSLATGIATSATLDGASAFGYYTTASGGYSSAEGVGAAASGTGSHAEGYETIASNLYSHSEGAYTTASGGGAHSEGKNTFARGSYSHTEGGHNITQSNFSHIEGGGNEINNEQPFTHVSGINCIPPTAGQNVANVTVLDSSGNKTQNTMSYVLGQYAEIVGNGTSDLNRSNARTLDWNGNEVLAGTLTVGVAPTNNMDVATKQYVDSNLKIFEATSSTTYAEVLSAYNNGYIIIRRMSNTPNKDLYFLTQIDDESPQTALSKAYFTCNPKGGSSKTIQSLELTTTGWSGVITTNLNEVFVVQRNSTTTSQIYAAYQAGKQIILQVNSLNYTLVTCDSTYAEFVLVEPIAERISYIEVNNSTWGSMQSIYFAPINSPVFEGTPQVYITGTGAVALATVNDITTAIGSAIGGSY